MSSAVLRRHRGRIARRELGEERRLAHRLEHVEIVVAGGAVGAERRALTPAARYFDDRRGAARQLHVAFRVVRDADVAPLQNRDVLVGHPDAVRGQRLRSPEADRLEIAGRRGLVLGRAPSSPRPRVSARWISTGTLVLAAELRRTPRSVAWSSVYIACGATAGTISGSSLNALMNASARASAVGRRLRVGDRKLDDRLAEHAAQARFLASPSRSPPRSNTCRRTSSSPTRSSRARPAACPCARTRATPSSPRPERCTSAASPSARGRRRARETSPSARGCAC